MSIWSWGAHSRPKTPECAGAGAWWCCGADHPPPAGRSASPPAAVAGVPRLFVGQVPTDKGETDLLPVFAPFGTVEKVTMVRGPEGRSKGCAMVQFSKWAEAEAAMEGVNGTSPLENGKGRPLVVHFANPRRVSGVQAAEVAIAPRKVFVGQIPKTASEAEVMEVFAPYGEVESVAILKSKGLHAGGCSRSGGGRVASGRRGGPNCCRTSGVRGAAVCAAWTPASGPAPRPTSLLPSSLCSLPTPFSSLLSPHAVAAADAAGCAFVQFKKWASCEAAIAALHEQVVMPGCEHPLVVKFADAKRSDNPALKRPSLSGMVGLGLPAFGSPHHQLLAGGYPGDMGGGLPGMGPPPHHLAAMGFGGLLPGSAAPHHVSLGMPTHLGLANGRANGLGSVGGSSENLLDSSTDGGGPLFGGEWGWGGGPHAHDSQQLLPACLRRHVRTPPGAGTQDAQADALPPPSPCLTPAIPGRRLSLSPNTPPHPAAPTLRPPCRWPRRAGPPSGQHRVGAGLCRARRPAPGL